MYVSSKDIVGKQVYAACSDDNIAIIDSISDLQALPSAVRMDSYAITVLTQGTASFFVDGKSFEMSANHMFVFRPSITIERTAVSDGAQYSIVVLTQQYAKSLIAMDGRNTWDILLYLSGNPVIELTDEQVEVFQQYLFLTRHHLSNPELPHHREMMDHLFVAMLYEFHNVIALHLDVAAYNFTNAERTFRRFYEILNETTPRRQKVDYFASQLNITPKYLSAICKQITGKSVKQHIDDAVLRDITVLLRDERLSVKEIAQMTGFPNQSFLGTYLRKHTGMSPYRYRQQLLEGQQ
jgi:AraC family transcriptional regulator, transcriptional activator of pobA